MKITISELRQIIIEEVEREAELEETEQYVTRADAEHVQKLPHEARRRAHYGASLKSIVKFLKNQGMDRHQISNIFKSAGLGEPPPGSLNEELTKTDKAEIKRMISKELDSSLQKELKKALEEELAKALKSKDVKADIGEISKKVLKKLYKDLSFHHPYIIDRIKV